ncbi:hypothetical protein J4221_06290 [Candidatus Pacearchaeota archaeon]|nr:hypothetical protein [Candidatus Pacearchaeota archaeon]
MTEKIKLTFNENLRDRICCRLNGEDKRLIRRLLLNLANSRYRVLKYNVTYQLSSFEPDQKIFCGWYGFSIHWPNHAEFFVDSIEVLRYSLNAPQSNSRIRIVFNRGETEISSKMKRRKLDEKAYEIYGEIKGLCVSFTLLSQSKIIF